MEDCQPGGAETDPVPGGLRRDAAEASGLPRRQLLATGAAGAVGVVVLAACGGSKASGKGTSGEASSSSAKGTSPSSSPSTATGAAKPLAKLADVPVGGAVSASGSDGKPVIVSQPTAGRVVAFSAICTHRGCTVAPAGKQLNCPCHGSVYDAATGKNVSGPAPRPLSPIPVHIAAGEILQGA